MYQHTVMPTTCYSFVSNITIYQTHKNYAGFYFCVCLSRGWTLTRVEVARSEPWTLWLGPKDVHVQLVMDILPWDRSVCVAFRSVCFCCKVSTQQCSVYVYRLPECGLVDRLEDSTHRQCHRTVKIRNERGRVRVNMVAVEKL